MQMESFPFWPARYASDSEATQALCFRKSSDQVCVFFLGSNNLGWVSRSNVVPLDRASLARDPSCKTKNKAFHLGLQKASQMLSQLPGSENHRSIPVAEPFGEGDLGFCQACSRSSEEGVIIVCDGCEHEYHLLCCTPPLSRTPRGDWFCHICISRPRRTPLVPPGIPLTSKLMSPRSISSSHQRGRPGRPRKINVPSQEDEEDDDDDESSDYTEEYSDSDSGSVAVHKGMRSRKKSSKRSSAPGQPAVPRRSSSRVSGNSNDAHLLPGLLTIRKRRPKSAPPVPSASSTQSDYAFEQQQSLNNKSMSGEIDKCESSIRILNVSGRTSEMLPPPPPPPPPFPMPSKRPRLLNIEISSSSREDKSEEAKQVILCEKQLHDIEHNDDSDSLGIGMVRANYEIDGRIAEAGNSVAPNGTRLREISPQVANATEVNEAVRNEDCNTQSLISFDLQNFQGKFCFICKLSLERHGDPVLSPSHIIMRCSINDCAELYHVNCIRYYLNTSSSRGFICPRHHCAMCHDSDTSLWQCSACPAALCSQHNIKCVSSNNDFSENSDFSRLCIHCATPSPHVRLAKLLERAWSSASNSDVALPFLRPMLLENSQSSLLENNFATDLLDILRRIRSLTFSSRSEYKKDLFNMMKRMRVTGENIPEWGEIVNRALESVLHKAMYGLEVCQEAQAAEEIILRNELNLASSNKVALPWRKECMSPFMLPANARKKSKIDAQAFPLQSIYDIPVRTLAQWAEYLELFSIDADFKLEFREECFSEDEKDKNTNRTPEPAEWDDLRIAIQALRELPQSAERPLPTLPPINNCEFEMLLDTQGSEMQKVLDRNILVKDKWIDHREGKKSQIEGNFNKSIRLGSTSVLEELNLANLHLNARLAELEAKIAVRRMNREAVQSTN